MTETNEPTSPERGGELRLVTLGGVSLQRAPPDAEPEEILGPGKPMAVLVYLASSPGRSATRDHLIDLLWANLDLDSARHALRQALWFLRKELGRQAIRSDDDTVVLSVPLSCDRDRFLEAIEAEDFGRAVDAYRGEFLPAFAAPGGAEFEKWADMERYRLRKHFLRAAQSMVQKQLTKGAFEEARELAERARDADPLNQSAWRLLFEALLAADDWVRAQVEARAFESKLDELGRAPEPALRQLLEAARTGQTNPADTGSGERLQPELIGREREFAAILSAWRDARAGRGRHVHVSAAAGLGKSRLLSEVKGRLEGMGARTILLRAHPAERDIRYALASELAGALADCSGSSDVSDGAARVLVALNPGLTDYYSVTSDDATGEQLRRRVLALKALLEAVAGQQPLAVLIDDLHWADSKTHQILVSLLGEVTGRSSLVVTTSRPKAESGSLSLDHTERITLEPLDEEGMRRLVTSLGTLPDTRWAEDFPRALHAATKGSPLLVLETLRLGLDEGLIGLEEGAWKCHDVNGLERELAGGRALRRRVGRLPDRLHQVLLLVSVAGRPVDASRLAIARNQGSEAVVRELRKLEVDGLLARVGEAWTVAHDEIGAVAVEVSDGATVRSAHREMGRVLYETAEGRPDLLLEAGRHMVKADDPSALEKVFRRWVLAVREHGDRRSLTRLAADLLGRTPEAAEVQRLVASVSLWRRLTLVRTRALALAAGLILAVAGTAAGVLLPGEGGDPEIRLYVLRPSAAGTMSGYEVSIHRSHLREAAAVDFEEASRPVPQLAELDTSHPVRKRPSRRQWATVATVPDSGDWETFLVSGDGARRRLTHSPGDDIPAAWSPDGRQLLLETSRWNRYGWQSLAVLDVETGEIRHLTAGDSGRSAAHHDAVWSPDGTRIAFRRQPHENPPAESTSRLCWITVDGGREDCFLVGEDEVRLVSWHGTNGLLALVTDSTGNTALKRFDLTSPSTETVDARSREAVVSPGGTWLASLRTSPGRSPSWHVFPLSGADHAVTLTASGDLPRWTLSWGHPEGGSRHLHRLEIEAPDTIPREVTTQLVAEGFTRNGHTLSVPVLRWATRDSARAVVDPRTGRLRPLTTGPITVIASAGGWRADTTRLFVEEMDPATVLSEDWSGRLGQRWVPFGEPRPQMSRHANFGRVFWARGDGTFYSGVYSDQALPASSGLGLRATVVTPRSAPAEQELSLALRTWDPESVESWDHRTGGIPGSTNACGARFPGGDGLHTSSQLSTSDGVVDVGRDLGSGEPYTLTLQLFPDGSCGVAVNGRPVLRSQEAGSSPDAPHVVLIGGKSVDTEMLVGPLRVWRGVQDDVDWIRLDDWSVESATPGER